MAQQIRSINDIRQLGTILSVWAHPDDETYSCAGIMAAAIRNGQRVVCVTATKGEKGSQDTKHWPLETLSEVRAVELKSALAELGITEHHWLGYTDGECDGVDTNEAVTKISEYIMSVRPDTILTFGPDGMTGHSDHKTVCDWACRAAAYTGIGVQVYNAIEDQEQYDRYFKQMHELFNIYFAIDEPPLITKQVADISFELDSELIETKVRALRRMPSQTEAMFEHFADDMNFLRGALSRETFILNRYTV